MRLIKAAVVSNLPVMPDTWALRLRAPEVAAEARPGQFVHLRCGTTYDPLLRRPFSIFRLPGDASVGSGVAGPGEMELLYKVVGRGTAWLTRRQPGDALDVLGPLGRGFGLGPNTRRALMVAGGYGIAPLAALAAQAARQGVEVTLLFGARTAAQVFPAGLLAPGVQYLVTTEDGSLGRRGLVTDLVPELLPQADQVFACGPRPMLAALARMTGEKPAQAALEERMACGVGVCLSCVIDTKSGPQRVCRDGPVFELGEVFFEGTEGEAIG